MSTLRALDASAEAADACERAAVALKRATRDVEASARGFGLEPNAVARARQLVLGRPHARARLQQRRRVALPRAVAPLLARALRASLRLQARRGRLAPPPPRLGARGHPPASRLE